MIDNEKTQKLLKDLKREQEQTTLNILQNAGETVNRLYMEKEEKSVSTTFDYREEEIPNSECIYG